MACDTVRARQFRVCDPRALQQTRPGLDGQLLQGCRFDTLNHHLSPAALRQCDQVTQFLKPGIARSIRCSPAKESAVDLHNARIERDHIAPCRPPGAKIINGDRAAQPAHPVREGNGQVDAWESRGFRDLDNQPPGNLRRAGKVIDNGRPPAIQHRALRRNIATQVQPGLIAKLIDHLPDNPGIDSPHQADTLGSHDQRRAGKRSFTA